MDYSKRKKITHRLYPKNAVASIIKYNNRYLLQLRDQKKNIFFPNMWGLFGGAIEDNETYLCGLKREISEELNIVIKKKQIKFFTNITFEVKKKCIERYIYYFEINKNQFNQLKISEGQKIGFFKQSELKNIQIVSYDNLALWLFLNNYRLMT